MKRSAAPTRLEQLVSKHVEHATTFTLTQTVELIAEQLAREILADHVFRARMRTLIERAFEHTVRALGTPTALRTRRSRRAR